NVDASGNWPTGANWDINPQVPNGTGESATFGSIITANRTVSMNGNKTLGEMIFDNSFASYTITQGTTSSTLIIDNAGIDASIQVNGNHDIYAPVTLNSTFNSNFSSGQLNLHLAVTGSGNSGITATGPGTLLLSASNNSWAGATVVGAGATLISNGG